MAFVAQQLSLGQLFSSLDNDARCNLRVSMMQPTRFWKLTEKMTLAVLFSILSFTFEISQLFYPWT